MDVIREVRLAIGVLRWRSSPTPPTRPRSATWPSTPCIRDVHPSRNSATPVGPSSRGPVSCRFAFGIAVENRDSPACGRASHTRSVRSRVILFEHKATGVECSGSKGESCRWGLSTTMSLSDFSRSTFPVWRWIRLRNSTPREPRLGSRSVGPEASHRFFGFEIRVAAEPREQIAVTIVVRIHDLPRMVARMIPPASLGRQPTRHERHAPEWRGTPFRKYAEAVGDIAVTSTTNFASRLTSPRARSLGTLAGGTLDGRFGSRWGVVAGRLGIRRRRYRPPSPAGRSAISLNRHPRGRPPSVAPSLHQDRSEARPGLPPLVQPYSRQAHCLAGCPPSWNRRGPPPVSPGSTAGGAGSESPARAMKLWQTNAIEPGRGFEADARHQFINFDKVGFSEGLGEG